MTRRIGITLAILVGSLASASPVLAGHHVKEDLNKTRPCGPDTSQGPFGRAIRYLFPQGFFGADFRPACSNHDNNYDTLNHDKTAADQQFLHEMMCACEHSIFKRGCRHMARTMYKLVANHGDSAYQSSQEEARKAAGAPAP